MDLTKDAKVSGFKNPNNYITNYAAFDEGRAVSIQPGYNFLKDKNVSDEDKEGWEFRSKADVGEVEGRDQDTDVLVWVGDKDKIQEKTEWMKGLQKQGAIDAAAREHTKKVDSYQKKVNSVNSDYDDKYSKYKTDYETKIGTLESKLENGKISKAKYEQEKKDIEEKFSQKINEISKKKTEALKNLVDPGNEFEVNLLDSPVKYNYKSYMDVINDPNATPEEKAKKIQSAVNAGADVEEVKQAVKESGDKKLEEMTKDVAPKNTSVKAELYEGRGREIDEAKKDLNKAGENAAESIGEEPVNAIQKAAVNAANAFQSGDGSNIQNRLSDIASLGRKYDPYYEEGLPRTLYGLYKQGRLGRITLTDEEKKSVLESASFSEDQINKLKEEGKTEEEIIKLQDKAIKKALKEKQREISKPARSTAAYFIIDYISKALQNVGSDVAAVGGKQISKAEAPALKTFIDEQAKGALERYNKAFEMGLEGQGKAGNAYSEWKVSDITGETKLNQNKAYDVFKNTIDKDMAEFMSNLTIAQTKELEEFNNELKILLETELAKQTPQAQLEGIYNAAKSGKYMNKNLLSNYATLLFKADPKTKMTTADKINAGLKVADTVGGFVGNVLGGAGQALQGASMVSDERLKNIKRC